MGRIQLNANFPRSLQELSSICGEIKPCPFCGGEPRVLIADVSSGSIPNICIHLSCKKCNLTMKGNQDEYILCDMWNRRGSSK